MKTKSNIEIPVFQNLGTKRWYYHFNHKGNVIADDLDGESIEYEADTVVMSGNPDKQKIEAALQSPVTDKGEPDEVYQVEEATTLDNDISLVVGYTDDVYKSVTRLDVPGLEWMRNEVVKAGQIRTHGGSDFECIQGHITQLGWEPDKALALWRIAPTVEPAEYIQPTGAHDAYNTGDQVLFEENVYESVIDNNVWSPAVYPQGWKLI
jgi:hypothetical protein